MSLLPCACASRLMLPGSPRVPVSMTGVNEPGKAVMQVPFSRLNALVPASGLFRLADGTALPYRAWMPADMPKDGPWAVVLALHGMNDSRDAWEYPAPVLAAAGIAVIAPDQRGFGASPSRGYWSGGEAMARDAAAMLRLLRQCYPHSRIFAMGESMGGAVLMLTATLPDAPAVDGYILSAPAVWGRSKMNIALRSTLWLALHTIPGARLGPGPVRVKASDNRTALLRLGHDPLTIHKTRVDVIGGVVDLMDQALESAPYVKGPALFLYGAHDELVPNRAMRTAWAALAPRVGSREEREDKRNVRLAYYPDAYHLLFRDQRRDLPLQDVIAWMMAIAGGRSDLPLPSGADHEAIGRLRAAQGR
ncbi:Esterase/Lipase [Granulibacter bethesdensis]|nr:Esterase/Lipase [Granulibacter bethesdensis]